MKCSSACINCLATGEYNKIKELDVKDEKKISYIKKVMSRLGDVTEEDTAPYLSYLFNNLYAKHFDKKISFKEVNKDFNAFVLNIEDDIRRKIRTAQDPLKQAILYSRVGNYIDFGAMIDVDKEEFLKLLDKKDELDEKNYTSFKKELETSNNLLLLADNCGEIVLDKLLLEEIHRQYEHLHLTVMVKGKEILNDATRDDAKQINLEEVAEVIDTGNGIAGSDPRFLEENARKRMENADIILSKGQANFETVYGTNIKAYFSFLCKCPYFAKMFGVEKFTGMFLKE